MNEKSRGCSRCSLLRHEALLTRKVSGWKRKKGSVLPSAGIDGRKMSGRKKNDPYRSGVVPYELDENGNLSILLVTPPNGGKWILPKGNIARGLDSFQSAVKEACEEAGVLGNARRVLLGIQESSKHEFIEFYPLEITQILPDWEESHVRSRLFFSLEDARKELDSVESSAILDALEKYVFEAENGI